MLLYFLFVFFLGLGPKLWFENAPRGKTSELGGSNLDGKVPKMGREFQFCFKVLPLTTGYIQFRGAHLCASISGGSSSKIVDSNSPSHDYSPPKPVTMSNYEIVTPVLILNHKPGAPDSSLSAIPTLCT